MGLCGRHLIAHKLSETETTNAEVQVFQRAFNFAGDVHPVVHTDRGSAYISGVFNNFWRNMRYS
ncbi:hypothetical protein CS304_05360 [Lactiplantibacillus plantarum]|nr:hypothetical protein LC611_03620 [Lactiplantibacillus plantarum]ASL38941.1 hypothetical protein CBI37_07330 [Lactiplantibacillus plantarum]ASZ34842.1 hypothetical protein CLC99_00290 [Lactiplantibacillus plantarum]AVE84451.1 hypothetical protein C4O30_01475 [Lactiplantibacillus plantarum]AYF25823.1 hypothetical protein AOZ08_003720 [Lactiplantibacillus plantarum]